MCYKILKTSLHQRKGRGFISTKMSCICKLTLLIIKIHYIQVWKEVCSQKYIFSTHFPRDRRWEVRNADFKKRNCVQQFDLALCTAVAWSVLFLLRSLTDKLFSLPLWRPVMVHVTIRADELFVSSFH